MLGDLGVARYVNNNDSKLTIGLGTYYYMAPEIIDGLEYYSEKADIW